MGATTKEKYEVINVGNERDLHDVMSTFINNEVSTLESVKKDAENNSENVNSSCLLRIPALAIWGHQLTDEAFEEAIRAEISLTHTNEIAIQTCVCYGILIKYLMITNGDRNDALEFIFQYATLHKYTNILHG